MAKKRNEASDKEKAEMRAKARANMRKKRKNLTEEECAERNARERRRRAAKRAERELENHRAVEEADQPKLEKTEKSRTRREYWRL